MSFQRIIYTPEQVRNHQLTAPPIGAGAIVMVEAKTRHLTNSQILGLAMDLLGPMITINLVKEFPSVLITWGTVLEDYGWGQSKRPIDLQMTLLVNAIKSIGNQGSTNHLEVEGRMYGLIQALVGEDKELETALITSLMNNKAYSMPWSLIIHLPIDPTDTTYGVWVE